jgi:hypothetical protein
MMEVQVVQGPVHMVQEEVQVLHDPVHGVHDEGTGHTRHHPLPT